MSLIHPIIQVRLRGHEAVYLLLGVVVAACSGTPKPVETERSWNTDDQKAKTPDSESGPEEPQQPLSLKESCGNFQRLRQEGCEWTTRFPADFSESEICETSIATWVDPATPNHVSLERTLRCWALDCKSAVPCMISAQQSRVPDKARECGDEGTAPILVDEARWQARRGRTAKRYSEVNTSVDEPVEVCGIEGEVEWMLGVACNDGSNPYGSMAAVNDGRDSWLDRGGRCNSVLDRYSVSCPEANYTVYVDRYVCPASP